MVNITVRSHNQVYIEETEYSMYDSEDTIKFLMDLIEKLKYSGETICLQTSRFDWPEGKMYYKEVKRW